MTLADSADSQSEKRARVLGCLCIDARPAVAAEAKTTTATAICDCFEDLQLAACQFKLAVLNVHDPTERGARVDLAILAMADCAPCWVHNGLICDNPTKAFSIHVHNDTPHGWSDLI